MKKIFGIILCVSAIFFIYSFEFNAVIRSGFKGVRLMNMKKASNYINGKFVNQNGSKPIMQGSQSEIFKRFLFGKEKRVPDKPLNVVEVDESKITGGSSKELKVTWFGHSSTIIEIEGKVILTDPILSKRPSPVSFAGPKRYHKRLPVVPEKLPKIDLVIVSHDHYDHLDYKTIKKIHRKTKRFVVPLGVGAWLEKWGVDPKKITELNWWQSKIYDFGIEITAAPSQHFSGRRVIDNNKTLWASWIIKGKKHKVFFSGDSGYNPAFKEIGKRLGPFDLTLMECGQYNKHWETVHMLPHQTVQAHIDVKGKVLLPIHWGAYNLSLHNWYDPVEKALEAAKKMNVVMTYPRIGETIIIGKSLPGVKWWQEELSR
jgi:L-ascorbate metabolism protein UlaG (beta-lactamase superfamily)